MFQHYSRKLADADDASHREEMLSSPCIECKVVKFFVILLLLFFDTGIFPTTTTGHGFGSDRIMHDVAHEESLSRKA